MANSDGIQGVNSVALLAACATVVISALWLVARYLNDFMYIPRLKAGQKPLPPGSLGLPLVGETLELLDDFSKFPDGFWQKRVGRHGKTGWYKTHLLGQPTIMATKAEGVKMVLLNDDKFVSGWPKSTRRIAGNKSFLCISGEEHKRLRRLTTPALQSPETLRRVIPTVEVLAVEALKCWADKGQVVAVEEMHKFTFNVIVGMLLSMKPGPETDAFCHHFGDLGLGIRVLPINLPGTAFNRALEARAAILKRLQGVISQRRAVVEGAPTDVLQSIITCEDEHGRKLVDEEIMDMLIVFLLAGHETSATAAVWIMVFLERNPVVLAKLQQEQRDVLLKKGEQQGLSYADCKSMTYTQAVIDETLRLINLSPFTFRKASENLEVDGFTIPKGWSVQTWFRATHLDPEMYPDPYTFNPDRWNGFKPKAGSFTPFGAGGRSCIGMDLAKLELSVIVHHLVSKYRWEAVNPKAKTKFLPHPKPVDGYPVRIFRL